MKLMPALLTTFNAHVPPVTRYGVDYHFRTLDGAARFQQRTQRQRAACPASAVHWTAQKLLRAQPLPACVWQARMRAALRLHPGAPLLLPARAGAPTAPARIVPEQLAAAA